MNPTLKKALQVLIFSALGFGILFLMYRNLNISYQEDCALKGIPSAECNLMSKIIADFKSTKIIWLILCNVLFFVSNISRTFRWIYLLKPLGYSIRFVNGLMAILLGYFANLGLPRVGEIVRPATLTKYENVPIEVGIGTVAVDRIVDISSFLLIFMLGLIVEGDTILGVINERANFGNSLAITKLPIFWVILILIGVLFYISIRRIGRSDHAIVLKVRGLFFGFLKGLRSITKVKNIGAFLFHSVVIWLMYYLMTYVCFFSFEPTSQLTPAQGLVIFLMGSLGIMFPSPGGMGSYHWLIQLGLGLYGVAAADGFSFAMIIFFAIQIFSNVFLGLISLIALPLVNKSVQVQQT